MNDSLTQISIVLDRSGSMADVRQATIDGFNEFVQGQKQAPGDANLTLIQFDSENAYELVFDKPIKDAPKLTLETYVPRGGTPLHDAIGKTLTELGTKLKNTPEHERPGKVVVCIMTDGLENASKSYSSAKIAEMIQVSRWCYKWEFIFLGANQDACLTGENLNIGAANSVTYAASAAGTSAVMGAASSNLRSYRVTGDSKSLNYTGAQRKAAMEEDDEKKTKTAKP